MNLKIVGHLSKVFKIQNILSNYLIYVDFKLF